MEYFYVVSVYSEDKKEDILSGNCRKYARLSSAMDNLNPYELVVQAIVSEQSVTIIEMY